jgi:ABC transporter substrate binding protein
MRMATDPVEAGFVSSLARPGGNITGVTSITTKLIGKHLELLAEVVAGVKRVAVIVPQTDPARFMARDEYKEMEAAARVLGVKLQVLSARDPDTIDNAFVAMTKGTRPGSHCDTEPALCTARRTYYQPRGKAPSAGYLFPEDIGREWRPYVLRHKQCR